MNWDLVAAIAEIIGIVGVIISIVYLGMQVRHSNQVAEDVSFKSALGLGISAYHEMIEGDHGQVIIKGLLHYGELRGHEKLIFDNVMTCWFGVAESALVSEGLDIIGDETAVTLGYAFRTRYLPYAGIHSWWSEAKGMYPPNVQQWIEQQMNRMDMNADFYGVKSSH